MSDLKVGRTIRFDKSDLDTFERFYPELLSLFVNRAIKCAISDKKTFDLIFFTPLLSGGVVKEC